MKKDSTLNRKKLIKMIVVILIIIFLIAMGIIYERNSDFRNFLDKYIFLKEKHENNLPKIPITSSKGLNTYSYKGKILILENNLLTAYNSNGNEEYKLDIEISNPIFRASGNYLCIGEKMVRKYM